MEGLVKTGAREDLDFIRITVFWVENELLRWSGSGKGKNRNQHVQGSQN